MIRMKLSEVKEALKKVEKFTFLLPNGEAVASHFHVTEVGQVTKRFIDCGGVQRSEQRVNFQLWSADDYDHRLHPEKMLKIIELGEKQLALGDDEVEVEYQGPTIGKYHLTFDGENFHLVATTTDCLAKDNCGIESTMKPILEAARPVCDPNGNCC